MDARDGDDAVLEGFNEVAGLAVAADVDVTGKWDL